MKVCEIDGTTKITGLLGNPVGHSLSPIIHNHAYGTLGLNYVYVPLGCEKQQLSSLIDGLRALQFAGANVTIPYKEEILSFCDVLSPLSQLTGTVNTLYWDEHRLCGTTTDGAGFFRALTADGFSPQGKRVLIVGNGGTARTLAMVLAHEGKTGDIILAGRNSKKVTHLIEEVYEKTSTRIHGVHLPDDLAQVLPGIDLLIHCTPLGMHPHESQTPFDTSLLSSHTYVFDAIYNPAETALLRGAAQQGCACQNGLRMLLLQGLESQRHWTGVEVPLDIFSISELQKKV
ncbi:shikimate dehydrogenase [Chitinivibrio alkaliphilus]|uniref:Shikimate dehydrogenase (NADP(+)) n=1 Tax=Chitinivibrio alkaliphilus ACht1 TaxID=1313304 RepID=U7DB06_9BACT|nr:shikimate dehydrogenase [Chitinivibrio alkaliphilus]ERP39212.1 shikimate 5-dehydrogenase [Chitinivibrio alkaliphilus ACht1]